MTIQFLKYIVAVAEIGSITEAAKQLHVSQPSLSAALKAAEKEVGFEIFTRSRSGVALTKEGVEFLGYARQGDTGDGPSGRPFHIEQTGEAALLRLDPALHVHGECIR